MAHIVVTGGSGKPKKLGGQSSFLSSGAPNSSVAWDFRDGSLKITNKPFGMFPLFMFHDGEKFGVATNPLELLPFLTTTQIDEDAIAVFLRLGFFIGDDTQFRNIRAFPAEISNVSWERGKISFGPPLGRDDPSALTTEAAILRYSELFAEAVEQSPRPIALPLSGGRDSRHILLELERQGKLPDVCVTACHFPPRTDEDVRVAGIVSRALGVQHLVAPQRLSRFAAEMQKNRITGFLSDEHAWCFALTEHSSLNGNSVADGIGGDVLSAGLFLDRERCTLYESGEVSRLADALLHVGIERYLSRHIAAKYSRQNAKRRLIRELEKHQKANNPLSEFYLWNRTRREISLFTFTMLGAGREVHAPFLYPPLVRFLLSLPVEMVVDKRFHTATIAEAYPKYSELPYEVASTRGRRQTWSDAVGFQANSASLLIRSSPLIAAKSIPRIAAHVGLRRLPHASIMALCLAQFEHEANVRLL